MSVLLETDALVANDEMRVSVWVENPSASALAPATLHLTLPASLEVGKHRETGCDPVSGPISLGSIAPGSVTSLDLCLRSKRDVVEGTFNVGFTLLYGRGNGPQPTSYILVEKSLRIGLFGNDDVAGVSLRLASFILPGLLFFFLLDLGGVGAAKSLDALKLSTMSVVFSLLLTLVASKLVPPAQVRGISMQRFVVLCGSAIAVGLSVLLAKWGFNAARARRNAAQAALRVSPNDDEIAALRKALAQRRANAQPVTVTLTDGEELIGSAAVTTADGGTALLGWFEVVAPGALQKELETLEKSLDYARLLDRVTAARLRPSLLNSIRERANGQVRDVATAPAIKRFAADDIRSVVYGPVSEIGDAGPIVVRS